MKIEGGFLPALAGLIPFLTGTVLPILGVGPLSAGEIISDWRVPISDWRVPGYKN